MTDVVVERSIRRRRITDRISKETGIPNLVEILSERLAPSDLQSLMMEVYSRRAKSRKPKEMMANYADGRFMRPSPCNPKLLLEWDRVAFSRLPDGFQRVTMCQIQRRRAQGWLEGSIPCRLLDIAVGEKVRICRNRSEVLHPTN